MKRVKHYIAFIFIALSQFGYAQISPGDLSAAHSDLEGMSKCTSCHDLGNKVTNNKCLECHKDIQSMINENRGFHSHSDVTSKDCFECHSEHHGKKFEMMRFDEKAFDHDLTGYILDGKHATIDCRECHKVDFIQDLEIKKRPDTFMGLSQECIACHEDYHQNTLSNDCISCHNTEAFRPAVGFDHSLSDFPLVGKHIEVDCIKCHEIEQRNGKEFQIFTDIPHSECIDCHDDPHEEHFEVKCTQCHTENSWVSFVGDEGFDHNTTNFTLKGSHQTVDCFECHTDTNDALLVFQDYLGVAENQCATCHEDVHDGKFGNDCAQCHNEESFLTLNNMDLFDHNLTDYPLVGKHIGVDCKECHEGSYTEAIDFTACQNCHEDYHLGEFAVNNVSPDCIDCHSLTEGFEHTLFTVDKHQETIFPLEGGHAATPCFACHVSEERWTFRNIGLTCTECHEDIHENQFAVNGITDCEKCHDSFTWFPSRFNHDETAFPLDGEHQSVDCKECHIPANENTVLIYKNRKLECIDCHQ